MQRVKLLAIALAILGGSLAFGHGGHGALDSEHLTEYYLGILEAFQRLEEPHQLAVEGQPFFYSTSAPHRRISLNEDALSRIFHLGARIFREGIEAECTHCHHHEAQIILDRAEQAWVTRAITLAKTKGFAVGNWARTSAIEVGGSFFEGFRSHGLGFAIWIGLFETAEHFVLDAAFPFLYAIPMCEFGAAAYLATVGRVTQFLSLAGNRLGNDSLRARTWNALSFFYHRLKFMRRTQWIFTEDPHLYGRFDYKAYFRSKSKAIEKVISTGVVWADGFVPVPAEINGSSKTYSLNDDLSSITSAPDRSTRLDRFFRHTEGLLLFKEIIGLWLHEMLSEKKVTATDYFYYRSLVGEMERGILDYRTHLYSLAIAKNQPQDLAEKFFMLRIQARHLQECFHAFGKLIQGDADGYQDVKATLTELKRSQRDTNDVFQPGIRTKCVRWARALTLRPQ